MTKLRLMLLALVACCLASLAAAAPVAFDPATMLDTTQIKRGDQVVSRSVFSGVTITEFHLTIVDVMHQANLGQDMILARILDGPVVDRQCGVVGGMSGSPVYLGGKLIGAIAWGWPFQKEPICGITPIRAMLETLDVMAAPQASAITPPRQWQASRPFTLGGRQFRSAAVVGADAQVPAGVLPLRPVMTPISCSGFGPQTLKLAQKLLGPRGLEPMSGGGTKADPVKVELEPGAAVGVRFMEGDFDMTGIGTVTWRQGDQLLAFGHPLMQLGRVSMPLTTAWINDFVANYQRTDKQGSGMLTVGTLQADTAFGVGGRLGPQPRTIPARIEVVDRTRKLSKVFNVQVFDQPGLTPTVMTVAIAQALEAVYNPGYEGSLRTHYELKGTRGARLSHDNQFYVQGSPLEDGIMELAGMMQIIEENRWEPQGLASLVYRAELDNRDEAAVIEKVYAEENVARAGKPLHVHALLRPDGLPLKDVVFTLNMPLDLPKGTIRIGLGGGDDAVYFRSRFGIMLPDFESMPEVTAFVDKMEQNKQLCLIAALPDEGVLIGSTRLPRIPPSIVSVFEESTRTDVDSGREELSATDEPGYIVYGRQMISLATEDRMGARGTVTSESAKSTANGKSTSSSSSSKDEESAGPSLRALPPQGLWWAESALKPATARRLREEAAAAGRPWPTGGGLEDAAPARQNTKADKPAEPPQEEEATETNGDETGDETVADTEETEIKTLVRQPTVWLQSKDEDFAKGEAEGITLRSGGGLAVAPALNPLGRMTEMYVWGAVTAGDTTYLGTGGPGRVYKVAAGGKPVLFSDPGVFAIHGMALDAKGDLYVGSWPEGRILRITPDGKSSVFCQLPALYVWALAFDKSGRLLAGTGPEGTLYAVDATGRATQVLRLPQAHILSLLVQGDMVYLGSGAKGVVYQLAPDGQLHALLSAGDDDITALVAGLDGAVFAASAGSNGSVYRLTPAPGGEMRSAVYLTVKESPIFSLALSGKTLYAATGAEGKLLAVTGLDEYEVVHDSQTTHLLCLASHPTGFAIGTGNAAEALWANLTRPTEGTYTSSIFDAARVATWGAIDWQATVPDGTSLTVQTRSGESPDPDDGSWSAWSAPYTHPGDERMTSPASRYLQYRVQMKGNAQSPVLRWLSLAYLPANQKPTVEFDDTLSVEKPWKGEVEVKWTSSDPDKDELMTTIEYRPAGTEAWQTVKQLGPKDESYKWKTADVKDGRYDVRLTVSDEAANPGAGLTGEHVLYSVLIDNTVPALMLQKTEAKDGVLTVEGIASDEVRVAEVAYRVGDIWRGALPTDGFFDGRYEGFRFTVPLDKDGQASLKLRCMDTAGSATTQDLTWPLTEEKPAAKDVKE